MESSFKTILPQPNQNQNPSLSHLNTNQSAPIQPPIIQSGPFLPDPENFSSSQSYTQRQWSAPIDPLFNFEPNQNRSYPVFNYPQKLNEKNFALDQEFIERALSLLPPPPDLNLFPVDLKLEQKIGVALSQNFMCNICFGVAWNPKICENCDKFYCTRCIDEALKNNRSCPCCRAVFMSGRIQRASKSIFEDSSFICNFPGCQRKFSYKEAASHLADHEAKRYKCVLKCVNGNQLKGHEEMRAHLTQACSNVQLKCTICNIQKKRDEIMNDDHKCEVEMLKSEVVQLKETVLQQGMQMQEFTLDQKHKNVAIQKIQKQMQEKDAQIKELTSKIESFDQYLQSMCALERKNNQVIKGRLRVCFVDQQGVIQCEMCTRYCQGGSQFYACLANCHKYCRKCLDNNLAKK